MPNWMDTTMKVTGPKESLEAFHKKFTAPVPQPKPDPDKDYNTIPGEWFVPEETEFQGISFWNFLHPEEEHWAEYFSPSGFGPDGSYGQGPYNWYQWNNANWGTKWDACSATFSGSGEGMEYYFETAWAAPEPVFVAMSQQFPDLTINVRCVEEQGFGFEAVYQEGEGTLLDEWDIPQTHDESVKVFGECRMCEWGECETQEQEVTA